MTIVVIDKKTCGFISFVHKQQALQIFKYQSADSSSLLESTLGTKKIKDILSYSTKYSAEYKFLTSCSNIP